MICHIINVKSNGLDVVFAFWLRKWAVFFHFLKGKNQQRGQQPENPSKKRIFFRRKWRDFSLITFCRKGVVDSQVFENRGKFNKPFQKVFQGLLAAKTQFFPFACWGSLLFSQNNLLTMMFVEFWQCAGNATDPWHSIAIGSNVLMDRCHWAPNIGNSPSPNMINILEVQAWKMSGCILYFLLLKITRSRY